MKKLSKKNSRLSRALNLHERRPPVCTVCLEGMLLQQEGGSSEGGAAMQSGGGRGEGGAVERAAVEAAAAAAAASRMAPGRASRVPFNLDEALQGRPVVAAAAVPPADPMGPSSEGGAGRRPLQVMAGSTVGDSVGRIRAGGRETAVTGRQDMDSLLDTQLWQVGALPPSQQQEQREKQGVV